MLQRALQCDGTDRLKQPGHSQRRPGPWQVLEAESVGYKKVHVNSSRVVPHKTRKAEPVPLSQLRICRWAAERTDTWWDVFKTLSVVSLKLTGSTCEFEYREQSADDPSRRCPDISLAKAKLGWEPTVPLRDGLQHTIKWFERIDVDQFRPLIADLFSLFQVRPHDAVT